jgi:catalase
MVPEAVGTADSTVSANDPDYLAASLQQSLSQGELRWHLIVTLAEPGDPTSDATKVWPADRRVFDAGTLVIQSTEPQESGPCRDVNYDPLVLPDGIEASDDPLLPARSAAYADSYLRRTSEEAHLPGTAQTVVKPHSEVKQ